MARCVILSACPVPAELKTLLRPDDFVIACDAGYRNCVPLGRKPNVVVGDFDTAPCPEPQDEDVIVLPHVKDDTDTEYAAKLASEKGFAEVLLLGALGGRRLEHTLANLATGLGLEQRGVPDRHPERAQPYHFCAARRGPPLSERAVLLSLGLPHGGRGRGRLRTGLVL